MASLPGARHRTRLAAMARRCSAEQSATGLAWPPGKAPKPGADGKNEAAGKGDGMAATWRSQKKRPTILRKRDFSL
ncbi:hypothetical protein [Azospira sp. I13]|uniref:hypothetical protein n=1 Tax=Azospira sp. I13 TaxID=1765050 RepID=UPI001057F7ED|nr:hypothetical protein [Azospira sp. I13]